MDRGAWWDTVQGGHKELDTTERLTLFLVSSSFFFFNWNIIALHNAVLVSAVQQHESAKGIHISAPS